MYLLVDIGGTNTRVAVARNRESFSKSILLSTPQLFDEGIRQIQEAANKLVEKKDELKGVIVGVAGPVNRDGSRLMNAPNLRDWVNQPLQERIKEALSASVVVVNDTDLVGLGEAHFGAGRERRIVAYITVSTGIGGSRIVDGKVDAYSLGFEPGHQILDMKNSLEDLASGASLFRTHGVAPADIHDEAVWEEEARILAYGVHNTIVFWSPDVVVLGGSLMKKISIERVNAYAEDFLQIFPECPPIVAGELGNEGGLWGALSLTESFSTLQ